MPFIAFFSPPFARSEVFGIPFSRIIFRSGPGKVPPFSAGRRQIDTAPFLLLSRPLLGPGCFSPPNDSGRGVGQFFADFFSL